jgi:hypothetical protein
MLCNIGNDLSSALGDGDTESFMRERQIPLASISKKKDNGSCFF